MKTTAGNFFNDEQQLTITKWCQLMYQIFVYSQKLIHQTVICLDFLTLKNLHSCLAIILVIFVLGAKWCGWISWFSL